MLESELLSAVLASGCTNTQVQSNTQAGTSLASLRRLVIEHGAENVANDLQQQIQGTTPVACKVCCSETQLLLLLQLHQPSEVHEDHKGVYLNAPWDHCSLNT